jgi:hypothetical protein
MAVDKCLARIEETLKRSSIETAKAEDILSEIKKAQREIDVNNLDDTLINNLSEKVLKEQEIQKKINQRNSLENEIKIRNTVDYVLKEFPEDPVEGLTAVLVGSNFQKAGSRASVALAQLSQYRQIAVSFNEKLRQKNLESLFAKANEDIDRRLSRTIWELGEDKPITEKNKDIVELAKVIHEFSETIRLKYNNFGANISKLPGWIVRQSHDPFQLRNAMDVLNLKNNKNIKEINGSAERNIAAWKGYIKPKLDERTFEGVDAKDRDQFLTYVYNSLIRNEHQIAEGAGGHYGGKSITSKLNAKRVLHFKTADDWFDYNSKFGGGNLRESLFAGFNYAGRNIGLMSTLGTNPKAGFEKIGRLVENNLIKKGQQGKAQKVGDYLKIQGRYERHFAEIDGSVNSINSFSGARWSGITRSILSMAKLGGAVVSALADVHLYGRELKYQGRTYLGGIAEAMTRLGKIKNSKRKIEIAEQLGFMADNVIYDLAARYSTGDTLNKSFTKLQRTFFKLNLLQWWTNSLKEGAMLGMGNYVAKQRNIAFNNLDSKFKRLINHFGIDEKIWNTIRKMDVEKAEDGKEFFSVRQIDNLSDDTIKSLANLDKMSKRQIDIFKDNLKTKVSGMFLDRSTYAVIEPDARTRSFMKGGLHAGTIPGEAMRFMFQFKAFPLAILQKAMGREISSFRAGNYGEGFWGVVSLIVGSGMFGYISMTAKDLIRGKSPKDPTKKKTFFNAMLQGGGLGIYGDFLFGQSFSGLDILATAGGPAATEFAKAGNAFRYAFQGEFSKAGKAAYKSVVGNTPFLNLFYLKTAFDYAIGYQIMETLSPGHLRKMEKRMKKETGQEFLLTKPSLLFKGF